MDSDELVASTRRLTSKLAVEGIPVFLGVLARVAWSRKWHLTIASSIVDTQGPRSSYPKLHRIVATEQFAVLQDDVSLVSPRDPFIREVSRWVKVTPGAVAQLGPIRLEDTDYDAVCVFK